MKGADPVVVALIGAAEAGRPPVTPAGREHDLEPGGMVFADSPTRSPNESFTYTGSSATTAKSCKWTSVGPKPTGSPASNSSAPKSSHEFARRLADTLTSDPFQRSDITVTQCPATPSLVRLEREGHKR